jgi:hypothetical protein
MFPIYIQCPLHCASLYKTFLLVWTYFLPFRQMADRDLEASLARSLLRTACRCDKL